MSDSPFRAAAARLAEAHHVALLLDAYAALAVARRRVAGWTGFRVAPVMAGPGPDDCDVFEDAGFTDHDAFVFARERALATLDRKLGALRATLVKDFGQDDAALLDMTRTPLTVVADFALGDDAETIGGATP